MANFKIIFSRAQMILILILFLKTKSIDGKTIIEDLPNLNGILDFLQGILRPYINSIRSSNNRPILRTNRESAVMKVIRKKIAELEPFLQDNDGTTTESDEKDNVTLDGKDETTIIEFIPHKDHKNEKYLRDKKEKNKLKMNVKKYTKLRKEIQLALIKEHVSEKTQALVTKTLDEMIAHIIENKCSWNSATRTDIKYAKDRVDRSMSLANAWNERWDKLKAQYLKYISDKPSDTFAGNKLFVFFEQFHDFLGHIVKDLQSITGKYKIVCQLIGNNKTIDQQQTQELRTDENRSSVKSKHKCAHFKVCSDELQSFMINFYNALNDTAVSVLRNYASMYTRDVNTDESQEKESVITIINNIGDLAEYKTSKIFRKETLNLKLSKNKDASENIRAIRTYIKTCIENTKAHIKNNLENGLKSLRAKLLLSMKQDLVVNLDMDFGNMERDFKSRICTVFSICNGRYVSRRFKSVPLGKNSVYVQVRLTLDDDLKDKLADPKYQFKNIRFSLGKKGKTKGTVTEKNNTKKIKESKRNGRLKSTRLLRKSIDFGNLKNYTIPGPGIVTRTSLQPIIFKTPPFNSIIKMANISILPITNK